MRVQQLAAGLAQRVTVVKIQVQCQSRDQIYGYLAVKRWESLFLYSPVAVCSRARDLPPPHWLETVSRARLSDSQIRRACETVDQSADRIRETRDRSHSAILLALLLIVSRP